MANGQSPWDWIGKVALYVALPLVGIYAVYRLVTHMLFGGGDAFMNFASQQMDAYRKKMEQYASVNNGVLNDAQEKSRQDEITAINNSLGNAAQAYNSVQQMLAALIAVATGLMVAYLLPSVYAKWKGALSSPTTQPKTAEGVAKILDCALVDQLAASGYMTEATALLTSIQNYWQSLELPQVQAAIASIQAEINAGVLTGFQLLWGQYMVTSLTFEVSTMIPTVLTLPLI